MTEPDGTKPPPGTAASAAASAAVAGAAEAPLTIGPSPAAAPRPEAAKPEPGPQSGPEPAVPPRRSDVLAWLSLAGFLVLAVAIVLVWAYPRPQPAPPSPAAMLAALSARIDGLSAQIASLGQKLATLPPPADLGPLESRVAALENRPQPSPAPADETALTGQIGTLGKSLGDLSARLDRIERLARADAAASALAEGRPLGTLPNAPAALARFAAAAPPTLASLRLSFPEAARAERAASRPSTAGKTLLQRLILEAGDLVTLRSGSRVIIGNPADAALAAAGTALDAGDLAAAVAAVSSLPLPLAPAMAAWVGEAKALLAAQAALATLD